MFIDNMKTTIAKQFNLKPPAGEVGIEIETEGRNLPEGRVTASFVGKADGSLRNGMEYVSKVLRIDEVPEKVGNLAQTFREREAAINPSYRSSTHIHYNMCNRNFRDVLGMMVIWALVEPVVFRQMPPGRDGSLFCVSSYDSGELHDYVDRMCQEIAASFPRGFTPRGKYSSLNLTRLGPSDLPALGTVEYRVFPSTLDGIQIQNWCNWIAAMDRLVLEEKDDSFLTMVRYAEQNPLTFLMNVFWRMPVPEHEAGEYVDFGARQAYEIARVINKHLLAKPKVKSEKKKGSIFVGEPMAVGEVQMVGGWAPAAPRAWDAIIDDPIPVPAQEAQELPVANFRLGFGARAARARPGVVAGADAPLQAPVIPPEFANDRFIRQYLAQRQNAVDHVWPRAIAKYDRQIEGRLLTLRQRAAAAAARRVRLEPIADEGQF